MPCLAAPLASDPCDHVVGGDPGRLVAEEDRAPYRGGHQSSCEPTSPQRISISSPSSRSVEKPAARLCSPPPCSRAIAETSPSPSLDRRLPLRPARPREPVARPR